MKIVINEIGKMEEFIKALRDGNGYDYIANNYYKMNKEDLKEIILDLLYLTNVEKELEEEIIERLNLDKKQEI